MSIDDADAAMASCLHEVWEPCSLHGLGGTHVVRYSCVAVPTVWARTTWDR